MLAAAQAYLSSVRVKNARRISGSEYHQLLPPTCATLFARARPLESGLAMMKSAFDRPPPAALLSIWLNSSIVRASTRERWSGALELTRLGDY